MTRFRLVLLLCGAIAVGAILGTTRARATICAYSENLAGYADGELCLTGGGEHERVQASGPSVLWTVLH